MRERLSLEMSNDNYTIVASIDNEVSLVLRNHSAVFDHIKSVHIKARTLRFKTKMSQGRVLNTPCIDYHMFNCYLTNSAITDNLVKFIYKCRMQLLACNSLLHRYYPRVYPKSCLLCWNPYDTVSHVLKGILHLLPKIDMFCALSENNQQLFWKINYASYIQLFKDFKNDTEILVGQVVFKLQIKTVKMMFLDQ